MQQPMQDQSAKERGSRKGISDIKPLLIGSIIVSTYQTGMLSTRRAPSTKLIYAQHIKEINVRSVIKQSEIVFYNLKECSAADS